MKKRAFPFGAVALCFALAACAPPLQSVPSAGTAATSELSPSATCPAANRNYTVGEATAKLIAVTAYTALGPTHFAWTVTFANAASPKAPVQFAPIVYGCGAAARGWGTAKIVSGSTESHCTNGNCTVKVTYTVQYAPPAKAPPPPLPLKYVFLKFYPTPKKAPYGLMNGALILLRKSP